MGAPSKPVIAMRLGDARGLQGCSVNAWLAFRFACTSACEGMRSSSRDRSVFRQPVTCTGTDGVRGYIPDVPRGTVQHKQRFDQLYIRPWFLNCCTL